MPKGGAISNVSFRAYVSSPFTPKGGVNQNQYPQRDSWMILLSTQLRWTLALHINELKAITVNRNVTQISIRLEHIALFHY